MDCIVIESIIKPYRPAPRRIYRQEPDLRPGRKLYPSVRVTRQDPLSTVDKRVSADRIGFDAAEFFPELLRLNDGAVAGGHLPGSETGAGYALQSEAVGAFFLGWIAPSEQRYAIGDCLAELGELPAYEVM